LTTAGRSATLRIVGLTFVSQLWLPAISQGQAWLPVKRETAVTTTFQQFELNGHFDTDGSTLEGAVPSRSSLAVAEFEYGLTDKLALNARLFYVASKFTGEHDPITEELRRIAAEICPLTPRCQELASLDTGGYYATFQDVGLMLRYNLLDKGLVVTPLVGATIPTHDYRTVGEAAAGQNLFALHTGVNIGRLLDPLIPRAYIHARYVYSFVQPVYDISLNRSNAEFEVGYGVTPTVAVRALAAWQQSHGGLSWSEAYGQVFDPSGEVRPDVNANDVVALLDHDRLLASRYWHVGGGATVALTDSLNLDGALLTFVSGADTHYGVGLSIGLTWRFLPAAPPSPPTRVRAPLAMK